MGTWRLWAGLVGGAAAGGGGLWLPGGLAGVVGRSRGGGHGGGGRGAGGGGGVAELRRAAPRGVLWRVPLHVLAQAAAVAVAAVALAEFGAPEGLGVVAGVLAVEAVLAGVMGTAWRRRAGSVAALPAGAYGFLAGWLEWDADLVVGVTAVVGVALAAAATGLTYWRGAPARAGLWGRSLHGLAQAAAVTVAGVALVYGAPEGLGVVAGEMAAEAVRRGPWAASRGGRAWSRRRPASARASAPGRLAGVGHQSAGGGDRRAGRGAGGGDGAELSPGGLGPTRPLEAASARPGAGRGHHGGGRRLRRVRDRRRPCRWWPACAPSKRSTSG